MADHIQIGDISPRIQYTGNGAQTAFTYPFPIFADADMAVFEDTTQKILTTDYTVSGAGASSGGSVTFVTAPVNGVTVTLKRQLAIQRTSDFQESGEFRSKVINDELDYLIAALQQVDDGFSRSLRLPETDTATSLTLPEKSARSSMYLGFDASGDPIATDATGPAGPTGPAGNMDGANNLSELTAVATARTNLGLGTAATKNTGTANGDVVLLDATGLPAVDGSQLTGLSVGATAAEKVNIMLNAFRIAINGGLSVQNMVDGVVDEFEDETGVDAATTANEFYDATSDFYTNSLTPIPFGTGTVFGDMTVYGGIAAAFDGDTTKTLAQAATGEPSASRDWYVGKSWTGTKTIGKFIATPTSDVGFTSNASPYTMELRGHTSAPTAAGDGTLLYTTGAGSGTGPDSGNFTPVIVEKADIDTTTAYAHHWLSMGHGVNGTITVAEIEFFENTVLNITLQSNANTANAQPDTGFIIIWQEDVDAVTLNTDLTAEVSRDGGTTWTVVTLAEEATLTTGRILTGTADISAQPAGTSMKCRIKTLNTKEQRIHGVSLQWS